MTNESSHTYTTTPQNISERPNATDKLVKRLKKRAKDLKKAAKSVGNNFSLNEALDLLATQNKYANWAEVVRENTKLSKLEAKTPQPSLNFIYDKDVVLTAADNSSIRSDLTRTIPENIKLKVSENKLKLSMLGLEYSVFEPTETGLKKFILDATQTVRSHFKLTGFHNFDEQNQGPDSKVVKKAYFVTPNKTLPTRISMYRPNTKKGDPRMWFKNLGNYANSGDQVSIVIFEDELYLINISQHDLPKNIQSNHIAVSSTPSIEISKRANAADERNETNTESTNTSTMLKLLSKNLESKGAISEELLLRLREIAKSPLKATTKGDTSIGMAIEAALGIEANSSKKPDYKGIEIKSGRGKRNRTTLFAQVSDWSRSKCRSSAEILNNYGYQREEDEKLYCTVNSKSSNSQGLYFEIDPSTNDLIEKHDTKGEVAVWSAEKLQERLKEKHSETFWIQAESIEIDGTEHFQLKSVVHTRAPLLTQLMPLIEDGTITMDHLIKKSGKTGRVSEKGPLFKIDKRNLAHLFPAPVTYNLI